MTGFAPHSPAELGVEHYRETAFSDDFNRTADSPADTGQTATTQQGTLDLTTTPGWLAKSSAGPGEYRVDGSYALPRDGLLTALVDFGSSAGANRRILFGYRLLASDPTTRIDVTFNRVSQNIAITKRVANASSSTGARSTATSVTFADSTVYRLCVSYDGAEIAAWAETMDGKILNGKVAQGIDDAVNSDGGLNIILIDDGTNSLKVDKVEVMA